MGSTASKVRNKIKVVRKPGDVLNQHGLPSTHVEVLTTNENTRISVCRCWKSSKFPICDNAHQLLQKQGVDCGPAMLEIRKR